METSINIRAIRHAIIGCALLISASGVSALESEIKLSGRKDVILSIEMRTTILKVAEESLARAEKSTIVAEAMHSPFTFKKPVVKRPMEEKIESLISGITEEEPQFIEVSDADVLVRVADSFGKQVRGVIAMGSKSFLQLEGGALLSAGTEFPARLPQIKNRSFSITISEVNDDGYVLTLGSESVRRSINASAAPKSRIELNP